MSHGRSLGPHEPVCAYAARVRFGLESFRVRGFRSARDVRVEPGALCALVGDANAGKSNLLAAVHALLSPETAPIVPADASAGGDGRIRIEARTSDGATLSLEGKAGSPARVEGGEHPPVLFLPAALRAGAVIAPVAAGPPVLSRAAEFLQHALNAQTRPHDSHATSAPAVALVDAIESCCAFGLSGMVVLIEEPELYLRPQAQRYLHRLLRELALGGNQVIYSTHAPAFLDVARLEELVLVDHDPQAGTQVRQPRPVHGGEDFRALSEFDAERSELFLARAAVLVEGLTEKLSLPFMFQALGHDADREAISIVECGGKGNLLLFMRICKAVGVPFVVIHDRDTRGHRGLNAQIKTEAAGNHAIALNPDFEAVAHLPRGRHKPEQAWRRFSDPGATLPEPLRRACELAIELAHVSSDAAIRGLPTKGTAER